MVGWTAWVIVHNTAHIPQWIMHQRDHFNLHCGQESNYEEFSDFSDIF